MKKNFFLYAKIIAGSVTIAAGIYFFMAPAQFAAGGISGLSIILRSIFPRIPISVFILALDSLLFIIGAVALGLGFGAKSIVSSLSIAVSMRIFEIICPAPPMPGSEQLVILIFGCLLTSFGQAVIFNQNASSGGTDIIAKIISAHTPLKIGTSLLIADMSVVALAATQFGLEKALFAALGVLINTSLINYFVMGFNIEKYVVIIPDNDEKAQIITDFILTALERGATAYEGTGAYSKSRKIVITTVVSIREFVRLKQFIREHDSAAFVTVQNLQEVMGEGFEKTI